MRIFKIGRMLVIAILLAGIIVGGIEQFSEQAAVVWAEVMPFTGTGVSVQGTHGGTGEIAKDGAKISAIQAAQDQAGIYVSSLSVMKDSALSQDEIATIVSDVVRIDEKNIKYETSILGDSDVQVVKYSASVTVYIDTDSLKKNIDDWRQQEEEKRQILVNNDVNRRKSIDELNRKVRNADSIIKQGAKIIDIQSLLKEIECETLAMKKNDEGVALGKKEKYQESINKFNESIDIKNDCFFTYSNRGNSYLKLGRYQEAINDYNKAIELNPKAAMSYIGRGCTYAAWGKYEEALTDFSKAIELNAKDTWAYNNRGSLYAYLKKNQQALDDYNKSIELNPKEERAYINRGNVYVTLKKHQQALDDYSKSIELNPKNVDVYYFRGLEYAILGKKQQAIDDFNKAIELNPRYANAYFTRGIYYKAVGDITKANADFTKAKELGYKG